MKTLEELEIINTERINKDRLFKLCLDNSICPECNEKLEYVFISSQTHASGMNWKCTKCSFKNTMHDDDE